MIPAFSDLNESEVELLLKAPILVCILIAGADGTIDKKEVKEAIAIASDLKHDTGVLSAYLHESAEDFEDKFKVIVQAYPYMADKRNPILVEELSQLNNLWPRLEYDFAHALYTMLLNIADKIANSSGGLLGIRSVDEDEARYIHLPMITSPTKN
jgi:hypothetical protein